MNKPVYLRFSVLKPSKTLMYEFWYDYVKPKYDKKAKLCYMDTDSFIVYIRTDDIVTDVRERFDTSKYELDRPLPNGKNEKSIGLMKIKLGGRIMAKFAALRPKTYSYLTDDNYETNKQKKVQKR